MKRTTRRIAKQNQVVLKGLLPDAIEERASAVRRAKSICVYTTQGSKIRNEMLKKHYKIRQRACENKKGNIYVCGYTTKNDRVVKPYCRKFPKKK